MLKPIFDTEISHWPQKHRQTGVATGSQASFQKIVFHCRKSWLFLVKCSFPRGRINFLKTRLGAYRNATQVWRWNRGQCEISVSKIGFRIQIYWNSHQNIKKTEKHIEIRVFKKWACVRPEKISLFSFPPGSYGFSGLLWASRNRFYEKNKKDVYEKNPEIQKT